MNKDAYDNAETYTISQLAQEFSITLRSIRFYEAQGLLKPHRNGKSRVFSRQDRVRLKLLLRGKRLGFSLTDIHELFHLYDAEKRNKKQLQAMLNAIQHRQKILLQQQVDIQSVMMELNSAERSCYQQLSKFD